MPRSIEIQQIKEQLTLRLNELKGHRSGDLFDGESADFLDQASRTSAQDLDAVLHNHDFQEILQVNRALEAIARGTYGICDTCAKNIPVGRLEALPYSTTCVKCKTEIEKGLPPVGCPPYETGNFDLPASTEDAGRDNPNTCRTARE